MWRVGTNRARQVSRVVAVVLVQATEEGEPDEEGEEVEEVEEERKLWRSESPRHAHTSCGTVQPRKGSN
jgi:hypothetical protein